MKTVNLWHLVQMKTSKLIKGIIFTVSLLLPLSFSAQALANSSKGEIRTLTIEQAEALKKHKTQAKRSKTAQKSSNKTTARSSNKTSKKSSKKAAPRKNTAKAHSKKSSGKRTVAKKTPIRNTTAKERAIQSEYVTAPYDYSDENPLLATTPTLIAQRRYFSDAERAIKSGDTDTALSIQSNYLKGYPLSLWIDYWYLANSMDVSKYPKVKQFIKSKVHQELGELLKKKYIEYLSSVGQYKLVSDLIGKKPFDDDIEMTKPQQALQCRFYEARWQQGIADVTASAFASKMYLKLSPYPSSCAGLIYLWGQNGYLDDKVLLEKFERAYITRKYTETTRAMAASLEQSQFASRVAQEMSLYDNPSDVLSLEPVEGDENNKRTAVLAFKRFANLDPKSATPSFETFADKFKISDTERLEIFQIIAKGFLSRQSTLEEVQWVDRNLPAVVWSEEIKLMRMRRAIWFAQWQIVYDLYDHLTEQDKNAVNWRYWKARAAREIGHKKESRTLMTKVAKDRSFFGFLAAQELSLRMPFNHEHLSDRAKWPQTVAKNKACVRFFEFRALKDSNAAIEWREIAKTGSNDEAMLMAEWALSTGNISYAISSVVAGQRWSALDYRFPKPFLNLYQKYSGYTNVPVSFLYGISRQESMLNPDIKSPVGAVGLMQLMPGTARMVSKKNNWSYSGTGDLIVPENNIRLGSAYLREMLDRFDNNRILAAAAYNAGPGRINIWKSKDGRGRDAAMYVENIPFNETRQYVQNVLLYDTIYKKLLTGQESRLLNSSELSYRY